MEPPLIVDKDDSKWKLLADVLKIFDSRRVKQAMARSGLTPADRAGVYTKIVLIAMYFSLDLSYVARELKERRELRQSLLAFQTYLNLVRSTGSSAGLRQSSSWR